MDQLINVLSILPLAFMCFIQVAKVAIPTFSAPSDKRQEVNEKLNKENCLDGLIGIVDGIVCLWFVASLVYKHNYNVDAWHNAEALWTLKCIAGIWLCIWLNKKGYFKLDFKTKKDSNKE